MDLPPGGLVLPSTTLHGLQLVYWLHLYDLLPYPPILHLLLSDPVWHPMHKRTKWRTHKHWTLASLWPNHTQLVEETPCGCGVRFTVQFGMPVSFPVVSAIHFRVSRFCKTV